MDTLSVHLCGSAPILLQQQHLELSSHLMHSRQLLTWDQRLKSRKTSHVGLLSHLHWMLYYI